MASDWMDTFARARQYLCTSDPRTDAAVVGVWELMEESVNFAPVYKLAGGDSYMFFAPLERSSGTEDQDLGEWIVGNSAEKNRGIANGIARSAHVPWGTLPDDVGHDWWVADGAAGWDKLELEVPAAIQPAIRARRRRPLLCFGAPPIRRRR